MKKANKKQQKLKKFGKDFKEFISRGNVIDLAVGVIIGGTFGKIISSLVNDIIMPVIGVLIGGIDFKGLSINVGGANISYGMFIQNIVDFLIIALFIFIFLRLINELGRKKEEVEEVKPEKTTAEKQLDLLVEIRDLMNKTNNKSKKTKNN